MANTEQIEAKLCAYVDGELDAAARAEIEQHLANHPQHRQLLQELMDQRELLRGLPREKAPDDLFDSFQTQLERSVLLDTNPARSDVAGRINPWTQVFSIAAVLLLAVGLFAVIYFVLPNQNQMSRDYAVLSKTTGPSPIGPLPEAAGGPATMSVASATPAPAGAAGPAPAAPAAAAPAPSASAVAVAPAPSIVPPTITNAAPADIFDIGAQADATRGIHNVKKHDAKEQASAIAMDALFAPPPLPPDVELRVRNSPQLPESCMVLFVSANNASAADQQVTGYLANNGILWEELPEPMPAPVEFKRSEAYASKLQTRDSRMRENAEGLAQLPPPAPLSKGEARPLGKGDALPPPAKGDTTPPPAAAPEALADDKPVQRGEQSQRPYQSEVAQDRRPTTRPAQEHEQLQRQQGQTLAFNDRSSQRPATQRFILAKLTRSQVAELNSSIIAQNNGRLSNFGCSGGEIKPITPALASSLGVQQTAAPANAAKQKTLKDAEVDGNRGGAGGLQSLAVTQPTTEEKLVTTAPARGRVVAAATAPSVPAEGQSATAIAQQPSTASVARTLDLTGAATIPASAPAITEEHVDVVIVVTPDLAAATQSPADLAPLVPAEPATVPAATSPASP